MLDERILGPIFDKARDYRVPVIFHSGNTANTDPLIIGHWRRISAGAGD